MRRYLLLLSSLFTLFLHSQEYQVTEKLNLESTPIVQAGETVQTPSSGVVLYYRDDGYLYSKNAAGVETQLTFRNPQANLLFSSDFQGTSISAQVADYEYINGGDWPITLWGSNNGPQPNGLHRVDEPANPLDMLNDIQSIDNPNGVFQSAFFQQINQLNGATQSPYQINDIDDDPKAAYITYWMRIDETSLTANNSWRAMFEVKSDDWFDQDPQGDGDDPGFRLISFLARDFSGRLYWEWQGDDNPSLETFSYIVYEESLPVPRNEWFKVEYYIKPSHTSEGRAWMKVNGTVIGDHHGPNLGSASDSWYFMMLWQLYGSAYPMWQYIYNVQIWDEVPYLVDTPVTTAEDIRNLGFLQAVRITQLDYDNLDPKDPETLYVVIN